MMGLGASAGLALLGGGVMAAGDIASMNSQNAAIEAQQQSLNLEAKQSQVAFSQKTLNNIESTKRLMGLQAVAASGQGESLTSPSLQATTLDTFQKGKETGQNIDTESKVAQISYKNQQDALSEQQSALPVQMLGNIAKQGVSLAALF